MVKGDPRMRATLLHRSAAVLNRGVPPGRSTHPAAAVALVVLVALTGCGAEPVAPGPGAAPTIDGTVAPGPVETAPADPAAPGTPITIEALDGPADRRSVRFSYHATGATGTDV